MGHHGRARPLGESGCGCTSRCKAASFEDEKTWLREVPHPLGGQKPLRTVAEDGMTLCSKLVLAADRKILQRLAIGCSVG